MCVCVCVSATEGKIPSRFSQRVNSTATYQHLTVGYCLRLFLFGTFCPSSGLLQLEFSFGLLSIISTAQEHCVHATKVATVEVKAEAGSESVNCDGGSKKTVNNLMLAFISSSK